MSTFTTRLTGSAVGVLCAGTVLAQDIGDYEALESGYSHRFAATAGFGYRGESDLDDGGKSSMIIARFAGGTAINVNENVSFTFLGSYTFNAYDFKDVLSDPWENVHAVTLAPLMHYRIDEKWSVFGGPAFGFSAEDGADMGDAFLGGGLLGCRYRPHDRLSMGMALAVFSRIEDDAMILPVPLLNWRFADDWSLKLGFQEVAANGDLGAELVYNLDEQWRLGGGVQLQRRRFRLSESGPVKDGVGQDNSALIYLKAGWQASAMCAVEAVVGISAGGEYRIENDSGHKLDETDYDPSLLIGLRGILTF